MIREGSGFGVQRGTTAARVCQSSPALYLGLVAAKLNMAYERDLGLRRTMATVYIETTILSYLTARPSRDIVIAGHQETTRQWWHTSRPRYKMLLSEVVLREIQAGDPEMARLRMTEAQDIRLLGFNDAVAPLARTYQIELRLPPKAGNDILHIAFSVACQLDYLMTWNCAHIANGATIRRLATINKRLGRGTPVIVTPEELLEE